MFKGCPFVNATEEKVQKYILENTQQETLELNREIFEDGLVSSLFAVQLMIFLEENFPIKIKMADLDMDNFKSVAEIAKFVSVKMQNYSPGGSSE